MQKKKAKSRLKRRAPNKNKVRLYNGAGRYIYVSPAKKSIISFTRVFLATVVLSGLFYVGGHPQSTEPGPVRANTTTTKQMEILPTQDVTPTPTPTPIPTVVPDPGKKEIMAEIVRVFGEDALRAIAIAKAESGLDPNREGIHRANTLWEGYQGECSIGLFQINLASDGCHGKWLHAYKIPGETLDEKIIWLKNYKNNIQIAKEIYDAQGFNPWSTFTNKKYQLF